MNKKKLIIISISIFVVVMIIGVSYAMYGKSILGTKDTKVIAGDIYMRYINGETKEISMTPSDTYNEGDYYEFTISGKNTSNKDIIYDIVLNHGDDLSSPKIRLDDKFLRFRLVTVDNNVETEVISKIGYDDITNKTLHVARIDGSNNINSTEVNTTYRLYTWVDGVIVGNVNQDYTTEQWSNVYTNIKVDVNGNFVEREADVTITITYNANGGSVSPTSGNSSYNGTLSLPTPTRNGYNFLGWFTASSGGTEVTNSTTWKSNQTIYAHWEQAIPAATATIASKSGIETTPFGKIYSGADPDNYVWFNGEQWRIVGIYTLADNKEHLKIVKATPSTTSQQYNSSSNGNAWDGSSIQTYLNGDYYSSLSPDAKDKIYTGGTWYAGAANYEATASAAWESARARPWTNTTNGNVGLIASYEYLYAAENNGTCWNQSGYSYDGYGGLTNCAAKDWLFSTLTNNGGSCGWLLSPFSDYSSNALYVFSDGGYVYYYYVTYSAAASPAVFLKSTVTITGGNGKSGETNSYKLG